MDINEIEEYIISLKYEHKEMKELLNAIYNEIERTDGFIWNDVRRKLEKWKDNQKT